MAKLFQDLSTPYYLSFYSFILHILNSVLYINHIFYFLYSTSWAAWGPREGGTALPRLSSSIEIANILPVSTPTICKPTNQSPYLQFTPGAGTRQPGTTSIAQSPQKLFRLSNAKLTQCTYSASVIPSLKNPNKGSGP